MVNNQPQKNAAVNAGHTSWSHFLVTLFAQNVPVSAKRKEPAKRKDETFTAKITNRNAELSLTRRPIEFLASIQPETPLQF
jgi:hypothetical protein